MRDADIAELCRVCRSALARPVVRQFPDLLQELHHPQSVLPVVHAADAGFTEGIRQLMPYAYNLPNLATAHRGGKVTFPNRG